MLPILGDKEFRGKVVFQGPVYIGEDEFSPAELGVIDGVVPGTGAASKAMVLDASGDITMPGVITFAEPQEYDTNTGIVAFATGGQTDAVALTGEYNNVITCATDGDSVKLPTAALGLKITVKNSGATSLAVFPFASDSINALAINLSVNIAPGGTLTFYAISGVVWETQEVLVLTAPTTLRGELIVKATDNDADTVTTFTNAAMGQASVISIPDPGAATANILLTDAPNDGVVVTATSAELSYLDLTAAIGIATASEAVVLDANGTFLMPAPIRYDANTGITAFATGGQGSAVALTGEFNNVTTCATAFDSVALPSAVGGESVTVKNSGVAILSVFPASSDSINALAVNLSVDVPVGGQTTFRAISDTVWESNEVLYLTAPTTQTGGLVIKASDNAGNTDVTITNASHGQATTVTIPDGGAATSSLVQSTAALTLVEADVLDGATAGTQVASKAVIADSNVNTGVSKVTQLHIGATGSETQVTSTAAELNTLDGGWASITTVSEVGASGSVAVQLQFKDAAGTNMAVPCAGTFYISEVATGLTRDPADTGIAVLTNGVIQNTDAAVHNGWNFVTKADGTLGFTITAATDSYWAVFTKPNGLMAITDELIVDA